MSTSSYDELLKQVECLKSENSHLRQELQDNSSHLSKLEHEACNMKDVLTHIQGALQDGECEYQEGGETYLGSVNSTIGDLSTDELGDRVDNESWAEGVDHVTCHKSEVSSPSQISDVEHELYVLLNDLDLERNALMREIQTEDELRECFYQQLEVLSQKLETLPLSENYNLQTDMMRRQVEYEAKKLEEAMTEKFGTSEHIAKRQEARLQRIRNIEAEMLLLQQRHREQQLMKQRQNGVDVSGSPVFNSTSGRSGSGINVGTNTALCGEIFVPKPGADNARASDRMLFTVSGGKVMVSIAAQTADVIIQENPDILQANIAQNNSLSSIYHGSWPIGKGLTTSDLGGIPDLRGQDLASVMSFNSTNTSSTNSSVAPGDDGSHPHPPQQQLGTKVEMVYSLLSMLGTHDKDDMSRTLLAMSSSQDSCIAMRQSGCLPLLIQLLHGSDKDSGLLGNTRGSKAARARASAALHNIVHSHPDDKRGRREARVLRLLEQIRAHCDQLRGDNSEEEEEPKNSKSGTGASRSSDIDHHPGPAIAALMKLSFDEEHRHAICTLGGLQAIAELLEVDHEANGPTTEQYNITMRRYACMALTNLTFGDGTNKALLCSMKGSMSGLVAQLASPNEDLSQVAASVLRNLSWRADLASKKTLREVSAVTTLMSASMQVKKESTLKSILSALWNLSAHCTENKADICAVPGSLEFLVGTLTYKSPSKTLAIIENGGGILRNVSSHIAVREDYRKVLRQHLCLQLLLKHLRSTSLTIVSNACGTLWNLSARCQVDQQALWEMGAVSMLRNLVHSKHKMISMGSAAALKNLLSARPSMKNLDMDRISGSNRPGLHARKVRALEQELDENLAETCENVESPRSSPTETKKENGYTRRFSGDNIVVFPVTESEPRRPMMRGHMYPRSGSSDSAGPEGKIRSPQRVARSGSQDSVGSTHSDISHDRSRAHTMLAKSSRLLHERQASSLDRKTGLQRFNSDGCSVDRTRIPPNSRILQVMQEVAMHAGLPATSTNDAEKQPVQRNPRAPPFQATQSKGNNLGNPQKCLVDQFGKKAFNYLPNGKEMFHEQKRNNVDLGGSNVEGDEQPINYSLKYQDVATGRPGQLNNRPQVKVGNFIAPAMMPRAMPNMVHNRFPAPPNPRAVYEPRHRNVGSHQGIPSQFGAYAETDIDVDDQPTNFSLRYAENVEENFQDQPINYSVRYHEEDSRYKQSNNVYHEAEPDYPAADPRYQTRDQDYVTGDARYQAPEPGYPATEPRYKQTGGVYQAEEESEHETYQQQATPGEETDPHCADCKLEAARRTNEIMDEYMPSFFLDDQVKTFCTEGTPYLSTATSLTDLTGKIQYKEDEEKKEQEEDGTASSNGHFSNTYEDETSGSGSRTTDPETGSTVIVKVDAPVKDSNMSVQVSQEAAVEADQSFHSQNDLNAQVDQPKTYCEEGTPVCFSRVSSLSSLHSTEARELSEQHGRHQLVLSSIEESDKGDSMSVSVIENADARKPQKEGSTTPGTSDVAEKEHKTVTFDDQHHVEETPLMFSRCSSLGSLSSFDTQSVHSSVVSEYSRRASEVVSPSELPDSPSETMPTSPKPEPEEKTEEQETDKPKDFTQAILCNADVVTPVKNLAALIAAETLSVGSKMEAPVVYADEGTPPTMSETQSILSALTIDDEGSMKVETGKDDSLTEESRAPLNEENSSMSEVSEGEEDILAQCISSAMPVPNNSSRKMRKSSSDNAIKKKSSLPKIDNLGSASKSKLPTKVNNITAEASKSSFNNLPSKDQKSPSCKQVGNVVANKNPKTPSKKEQAMPPNNQMSQIPHSPGRTRSASKIAQNTRSPSRIAQSVARSPQTPRTTQVVQPQTPRSNQNNQNGCMQPSIQRGSPKHIPTGSVRPTYTPNKAPSQYQNNLQQSTPRQMVPNTVLSQPQSTPNQNTGQYVPNTRPLQDINSYSPDFGSDTVRTYATEGTPLNFSNANSVSDLSSLSFDEASIHFKDSPIQAPPPDDIKSDNSSLCEETEELLVSQVIQAAMPKSKVARRLDMDNRIGVDREAEGAEQPTPSLKPPPVSAVVKPQQVIAPVLQPEQTVPQVFQPQQTVPQVFKQQQSVPPVLKPQQPVCQVLNQQQSVPPLFQPQRTSSLAAPEPTAQQHGRPCEAADTVKTYNVEGTPLNFSNATSLSDLTIDSVDDVLRFKQSENGNSKFSITSPAHSGYPVQADDSVFYGTDSVDSPQLYQTEDTPITFSRNDSLSELSILSEEVHVGSTKHVEVSGTVSSSSSSVPKERHVVGQSSEESSVILDQTRLEDKCQKYAMEDTPMCFSRNSSLSSLNSPEPEPSKPETEIRDVIDQHVPYKVEDTPTVFSRNSSLSELSVESTAFDATEQALLDECISSAMPKSRICRGDDRSRRSVGGRTKVDKRGKKLSKSASLEISSEGAASMDEFVFKKPGLMTYSCSDAQDMQRVTRDETWKTTSSSSKSSDDSRFTWKRSQSQDSEYFQKEKKENSNIEIANGRPYLGSADTLEETSASFDNRMLEEARSLREKILSASFSSAATDSVTEKIDSEKSHLNDSFIQKMALTQSQCTDSMDSSFPKDLEDSDADTTVVMAGDNTVLYTEPEKQDNSESFEEEISPEDILLLEENASLIVSELSTNQMSSSGCDDDMFIENETLSLVSNDYTSDTASEISVSWSNTSEKLSEYSGSTLSQADGSVASQKGAKIIKPDKKNINQVNKADPAALRGRRKPLYSNKSSSSSVRSSSTAKSDMSVRTARSGQSTRGPTGRCGPNTGVKKTSPRSQAPSATSTPNKPAANNRRLSRSPAPTNRSSSTSGIPRSPLSKTSPPSKGPSPKESNAKAKADRPKPPIKQGTFTKDSSSICAPTIDQDSSNSGTTEAVKLREKKSSPSQSQRNSGSSGRNSSGSPPEAWSKALDGFNFIVDTSQENGYNAPYKQIQMQKNAKDAPGALKRPNTTPGKKPSNIARPVPGQCTPPRSNSKTNLNKSGSGSNLRKTSSGASLTKTQSGSSLNKTSSGSSLNRGGSASNLKRMEAKSELKKSDSNASLKNNSRPTTPVGRRSSNSSISGRKVEGASPNKPSSADKKAATPASEKKPPVAGKKQVPSKIATLWKKEDGDTPLSNSVSRLPVAASAPKTKRSPKPSGLPTPPKQSNVPTASKAKARPPPPKRTDSLARDNSQKEGLPKSSTYDKISADLDSASVPNSDVNGESDVVVGSEDDLNTAFQESPSVTVLECDSLAASSADEAGSEQFMTNGSTFGTSDLHSRTVGDNMSSLSCSVDSLDDISMHSLPVNSGTWKKKRAEGSLTLPNADETCRSVPSSLSTIVNQSCDDSIISMNTSTGPNIWRRYDESGLPPTGEPQIWVKRDSKKDSKNKSKGSKKESKSVAQSIKSTLFGKKPGLSKIFGSQKSSSKEKKNKEDQKAAENCRNLLANPKAGTLWQESRTSPSAIVPPFNYSPPANTTPKPEPIIISTRPELNTSSEIINTDNKKVVQPTPTSKHATKTEMLLARRRQSYLNSSMKLDESNLEDDSKRPCMVTTV